MGHSISLVLSDWVKPTDGRLLGAPWMPPRVVAPSMSSPQGVGGRKAKRLHHGPVQELSEVYDASSEEQRGARKGGVSRVSRRQEVGDAGSLVWVAWSPRPVSVEGSVSAGRPASKS